MSETSPIERALVTGGAGFLGRALVAALRARGVTTRVLDLRPHRDAPSVVGDVADPEAVARAVEGVDTVFHTAARIDWSLNKTAQLERAHVEGTATVVRACEAAGVARLVHTSSVDVMSGGGPYDGGDESLPLPTRHYDDYSRTKAIAEGLVLAADRPGGLRACALRVANIWGPGDPILVPRFVDMARRGPLVGLGDGAARYGFVYLDNAVDAHLRAADALAADARGDGPGAGGEAFFVSDDPPINFFEFFSPMLAALGLRSRWWWMPAWPLRPIAIAWETANRWNLTGDTPPALTRFTLDAVSQPFWFRADKARRVLGWAPVVPPDLALATTVAWARAELLPAR
ncbi:NAD-dependent epimerase/dehydratase family protein [Myxococcota bacterium]|nr:NAD-dependent epimerase/dehydratase family protein [Myxococcota bacterium]